MLKAAKNYVQTKSWAGVLRNFSYNLKGEIGVSVFIKAGIFPAAIGPKFSSLGKRPLIKKISKGFIISLVL